MSAPILVVGDAILDRDLVGRAERLCPEQPVPVLEQHSTRSAPGGAALAAALLARDGRDVVLLTAIAHDDAGCELADLLAEARVTVVDVGFDGSTPEKVRLRDGRSIICRLDRGGGVPRAAVRSCVGRLVGDAAAVLVADYGGGLAADLALRGALAGARRLVWDPHPRGPRPASGATLVTPNEREARLAVDAESELLAERLRERWGVRAVCVTRGERGALLCERPGRTLTIPVERVAGDPCGAGDRFASTAAALVADGVPLPETVHAACVEAASFVAGGGWHGGLSHAGASADPVALVERVRARGGTVVATGGCFDLLHAGHVSMLQSARNLGDCLVVLLNSDSSVRRLKGPDRPLVGEDDRASVLRSLECVDAVVLFDEPTPEAVLRRVRPDVFVKGADYDARALPEAEVMAALGGRVATVPYVDGHSTSGLIEKALARDA
jgi:rfaE bifunctional protein nucleotidyltransferase chain/domain/rfaE bifunctional protein kinase chain/domain